jgi:hypothetical protein
MLKRAAAALVFSGVSLAGCDRGPTPAPAPPAPSAKATATPTSTTSAEDASMRLPAPARLVAIGDLHGDIEATRKVLRLAGAIDDKDGWVGGALWVVQTGDQLDRGDGERAIVDLFERLAGEAKAAGGAVIALNGNHEVMNVALDFRYVTEGGFKDFVGATSALDGNSRLTSLSEPTRARAAAFVPGGPYARKLAARSTIAIIGDTVFAHGGVLPKHVKYGLARINREVSAWMNGNAASAPSIVTSEDGPIWTRRYSAAPDPVDCALLTETLAAVGAKRMVVGHTVQREGITSGCDKKVWRIDVGLARFYGGKPAALEIRGDAVQKLGESAGEAPPKSSAR